MIATTPAASNERHWPLAISGCSVPIILTALKRDPATASSIILTTVTDVSGFFSFLGLATLLSRLLET